MKKILITGKGSYIGSNFKKYLERYPKQYQVDELDMIGDSWQNHDFSKYDIVYHVAGLAHSTPDESQRDFYYEINTNLTYKVASKAKCEGVKQFIFMSSIIVYGSGKIGEDRVIRKETPLTPDNFYGDSKKRAEEKILPLETSDFKIVIIRPPMIYGPKSKGNYPLLAKFAKKTPIFPTLKNERSMLFLGNLMEFIKLMIDNEEHGVFLPQNDDYVSSVTLIKEIAKQVNHKIYFIGLFDFLMKFFNKQKYINKIFGNLTIDKDLSMYKSNYNKYSFEESIFQTEVCGGLILDNESNQDKSYKVCIINCFDTYEHRVDLLREYFKNKGAVVSIYTSDYRHIDKCKRICSKEDFNLIKTKPYKKNLSLQRLRSHKKFAEDAFKQVENSKYDILWVLVPPNSLVKKAAKYKMKNKRVKLIFDLIDLWPETMPISKLDYLPPFKYWRNLRDKYLDVGDKIVLECNLYSDKLPSNIPSKKMSTLYLAREIKELKVEANLSSEKISLCYLGSINNIIDIPAICKLICNLRTYKPVEIHVIGDGENRQELLNKCETAGAIVNYYGKVYDQIEKERIMSYCHYGLNIMKNTVCVGLTMKSMDYFEFGLPIINNIRGDTWDFIESEDIGFNLKSNCNYEIISRYNLSVRENTRNFFVKTFGLDNFENKVSEILKIN